MIAERTREMRLRRTAERRGYSLKKSRRRDPFALGYGKWFLERDGEKLSPPYGSTLDEVEKYLNGGQP